MTLRVSIILIFLAFLTPFITANRWSKRHQEVGHRARGDVDLHKRQSQPFLGARFTYYQVGLGACGQTNYPSDFIVALNVAQYGEGYPGPQCFRSITIQYNGKTAVATIMDECMGCPLNALDFSEGLFSYLSNNHTEEGVLYGDWWYNDDNGSGGQQTTTTPWEPPATTSSTQDYTPSPTTSDTPEYTPPPPTTSSTSIYTPTTSSTLTTSTTSTTLASSTSTNFGVSGLAVPTGVVPTPGASNPENILVVNDILIEIGIMFSVTKKDE